MLLLVFVAVLCYSLAMYIGVSHLARRVGSLFSRTLLPVALDIGSVHTRVYAFDQLLFFGHTSLIVHRETGALISYGSKAFLQWDKIPKTLDGVRPIRQGVVADPIALQKFLSAVFNSLNPKKSLLSMRTQAAITVPGSISPVETAQLQAAVSQIGVGRVRLVSRPMALFQWLQKTKLLDAKSSVALLDLGGETSELAFFASGELAYAATIPIGGQLLVAAIRDMCKEKLQLAVSAQEIEKVVSQLGTATSAKNTASSKQIVIRGTHSVKGTIETIRIAVSEFSQLQELFMQELTSELLYHFAQIPSGVVSLGFERGMYVTGGVSQMPGIATTLTELFHTEILLSRTPVSDVVEGAYAWLAEA